MTLAQFSQANLSASPSMISARSERCRRVFQRSRPEGPAPAAEHLGVMGFAQHVHLPSVSGSASSSTISLILKLLQLGAASRIRGRAIRRAESGGVSDNPPPKMKRRPVAPPSAAPADIQQQRQISGTAADGFEQVEAARQGLIGIRRCRADLDDARHHGIETLAHLSGICW